MEYLVAIQETFWIESLFELLVMNFPLFSKTGTLKTVVFNLELLNQFTLSNAAFLPCTVYTVHVSPVDLVL